MTPVVVGLLSGFKGNFDYRSTIEHVNGVRLHADLSNIQVVSTHPELSIDVYSPKTIFGTPKIDITYHDDQAVIHVRTFHKGWKKILPDIRQRGEIRLNIPPGSLQEIQLHTKNGQIEVDRVTAVRRLSLISDIGGISMNQFQGELLEVESGNGSVRLGEVDGQVHIRNKVGSVKHLSFKRMKGDNRIQVSNGSVNVQLPQKLKTDEIGLHLSTKNGKIRSKERELNMIPKGPGKEVLLNTLHEEPKLNISVVVGNIDIN